MANNDKHFHSAGTDLNIELQLVLDRFPVFHEKVVSLYNQSAEFQGLCSDYYQCVKSLGHWETTFRNDEQVVLEYSNLKQSLEQDFCRFLEKRFAG